MTNESAAAPADQPYRGDPSGLPRGIPTPPSHMSLFKAWRLLKRWHYVSLWGPDIMICAATVRVGPLPQEYWAVWDRPSRRLWTRSHFLAGRVRLDDGRADVEDGDVEIRLSFQPTDTFDVYRPVGRAYAWGHKEFCPRATASLRLGSEARSAEGAVFVDRTAGYWPRRTQWRWSAGAGTDESGRTVAWSALTGLFDSAQASERTLWTGGSGREIGAVRFSSDLSAMSFAEGGEVLFEQEAVLRRRVGLVVIKSKYDHAFGAYSGTLPNQVQLRDAFGVRERQDALW